jgi:hypothetical protein
MFLEYWMIAVLAALFGVCALWNRKMGIALGAVATLQRLVDEKIVAIENDQLVPYRNAWAPKPRRRRKNT